MTLLQEILALALLPPATNITTPLLGIADMAITRPYRRCRVLGGNRCWRNRVQCPLLALQFPAHGHLRSLPPRPAAVAEDGGDILARSLAPRRP